MKFKALNKEKVEKDVYGILHIVVLLLSLFLVISISIDTFKNIPFETEQFYLKNRLWICLFFMFVFFLELIFSENKWKYLYTHFIFLLISIPYLDIIDYFNFTLSKEVEYFVRFIPLVRGGYALAFIVGQFTESKATSLFFTYLTMLFANVYFSSLLFFAIEHKVNPQVKEYLDALWWALMNVTTVGSNIYAVTVAGKILTVVIAALGMMMFPIFTVYVTSLMQKKYTKIRHKKADMEA